MAKVYIGVGHGGSDSGAVKYLVEKDINLQMAIGCRDYLTANGVRVMMSRETDKDSSISEKTSACNKWDADVALDIHNNAGGGVGFEVYHSVNGGTGKTLAANIEKAVVQIGQKSRGCKVKQGTNGDYYGFIRQTKCPAVICEGVFVDNEADAKNADTEEKCRAFGVAYAKGILATLGIVDKQPETSTSNPSTKKETTEEGENGSYLVKVTTEALNIRKGAGTDTPVVGVIRDKGVYTIVGEATGEGASKWGKLKSGAGWIALDYVKRV